MKCPACTLDIAEDSLSCPSCGAEVDGAYAETRILPDDSKPRSGGEQSREGKSSATSARSRTHATSDSLEGARFVAGTILNERYRVVGLVGRGGMGEVYRAEDLTLEQPVALKFLPEALSLDGAALARSEEHTSELQSRRDLVCRLLL